MTVIKRRWKENGRRGKKIVSNKTINGCDNPWVGQLLSRFRGDAKEHMDDSFYALAYLLEEYGDQAIEEVAELSKEEQKEYVGAIEIRLSDDDEQEPDPRAALEGNVLNND